MRVHDVELPVIATGIFCGQLIIGSAGLTQAELLPESKPVVRAELDAIPPAVVSDPLPAI